MYIVVAFSVLPVEQVHLRVIAIYENENQATVDLGDHVKRALCDYGNANAVIFPQVESKNEWKNLKNGSFFGQVDGEREMSIWRKYSKPGRLYGETPKRKLVETFRCICHEGSIIVFPKATPVLKVSKPDEKRVNFGNVLAELQEKLNKPPVKVNNDTAKSTSISSPGPRNIPLRKRARKTAHMDQGDVDFLHFVDQMNPLSVTHEYYVQPKRVIQKYVTEETKQVADELISDIFAKMQEETKVHFDAPIVVSDEEFFTPCPKSNTRSHVHHINEEVLSDSWPPCVSLLNDFNRFPNGQEQLPETDKMIQSYQDAVNEFQKSRNMCFDGYYDW